MTSVDFEEANTNLMGDHLTDHYGQKVGNIRAYQGTDEVMTKWRMSGRERLSALLFGTVWLRVLGAVAPPVSLNVERNAFE